MTRTVLPSLRFSLVPDDRGRSNLKSQVDHQNFRETVTREGAHTIDFLTSITLCHDVT